MYGPTPKISISTSTPGPRPSAGKATNALIEPPSGIEIVSVRSAKAPGNLPEQNKRSLLVSPSSRAGRAVPVPRVIVALLATAVAVLAAAGPATAAPPIKHVF